MCFYRVGQKYKNHTKEKNNHWDILLSSLDFLLHLRYKLIVLQRMLLLGNTYLEEKKKLLKLITKWVLQTCLQLFKAALFSGNWDSAQESCLEYQTIVWSKGQFAISGKLYSEKDVFSYYRKIYFVLQMCNRYWLKVKVTSYTLVYCLSQQLPFTGMLGSGERGRNQLYWILAKWCQMH